jgi:hypothetical protein
MSSRGFLFLTIGSLLFLALLALPALADDSASALAPKEVYCRRADAAPSTTEYPRPTQVTCQVTGETDPIDGLPPGVMNLPKSPSGTRPSVWVLFRNVLKRVVPANGANVLAK